ncbi:GCN5-like 1 [Plasmopara halstedii]|uniref:GCN5-like 1 n=1 Tax=Plasmopara halstedii TaxID=4781 RepID=A0A0P1AF03_PLAHL|nr:GCN5-like 1 [Plasmopara halstedii]CEG39672.1 GCN5-like 1 [Plasmopara halstedii]|eukprot:XP_024576041.1 GCN5-like 1 [Plasmopara halstedii]
MSASSTDVKAAEVRITQHRDDAMHAKVQIEESIEALKTARNRILLERLDEATEKQRLVEQEALAYSKNVNRLYQRAAKWKTDQKRFRTNLNELDGFAEWAASTEKDLHAIAGNLEYVWAVLEKDQDSASNDGYVRALDST